MLEQLTNPRVRDEVGDIALVPPEGRVGGLGASYVMAAFTHLNPKGSRFSDGSCGVYYAAAELETAIIETAFHFEAFARDSSDPPRSEDFQALVGAIEVAFEDVAALPAAGGAAVLAPGSYAASQAYGKELRASGANGLAYPSVRHTGAGTASAFSALERSASPTRSVT